MLALAQAEVIRRAISAIVSHRNFELVPMTTSGDEIEGDLPPLGGKGLFVSDIQDALASGKIDLAVHSAKDLPARAPDGVALAGIPKREDPRDALVTRTGVGLGKLEPGTTVGTSSLRRTAQLLALRQGLVPIPIRGNVDTRLRKVTDGEVQALVVAVAGLKRLRRTERIAEVLPINVMLPAPGQGALAVECRTNDKLLRPAIGQMEDAPSRAAFEAERSFMLALGGDCTLPLGALAEVSDGKVRVRGLVVSVDGTELIADQVEGDDPDKAGLELAERLRARGADELIASLR
jgi:hydroxymethylbilane synthase